MAYEDGIHTQRTALQLSGWPLITLSFQALGIIYSDIGTSPLYTLNGIWPSGSTPPSHEDIIGGISAIIWAITLLPLAKYAYIAMWFGTKEGEGGSFALYQGLYPRKQPDVDADRTLTGESFTESIPKTSFKEKARWPLLLWCLFGTALTMADGVFTPAVSVTSAVSGIGVAKPSVDSDIVGISVVFLLLLFFVQQFGTHRLAFAFAPISFIWFLILIGTGIYNITFFPGILRAFDPSRAILLFVRTKDYGLLSGVILALTGCEALFANLGQFNAKSIRISFTLFVYPAIVLAYLGQGARLCHSGPTPEILTNIFYTTIPGPTSGPLYWIVFVFGILATLIASQALITATFSLIQQLINSKAFPPLRMLYTSETIQGQVYIPAVNWVLMIVTIVVVAAFGSSTNLSNAYGFAVATVMFSTSWLIGVQIYYIKHLPLIVALAYFIPFGFLDGLFWGATLRKVPHGAWVPLMFGCILLLVMALWVWSKALEDEFDSKNRMNLRHFISQKQNGTENDDGSSHSQSDTTYYMLKDGTGHTEALDEKTGSGAMAITRIPSCAIFHKVTAGAGVPHTFTGFIRQWPSIPRVVIFLSVNLVPIARVPVDQRYAVTKVRTVEGFYGVTYYVGFRDGFNVRIDDLIDKICLLEAQINPAGSQAIVREIRAVSATATHIAPHYHVVSRKVNAGFLTPVVNYLRATLIESVYRRLATMFPETANWLTSADEIIHVGINAVI